MPPVRRASGRPGQHLRPTRRKTGIHILQRRHPAAWLYEMGIPVLPVRCLYDLRLMPKAPKPPNQDTVGAGAS